MMWHEQEIGVKRVVIVESMGAELQYDEPVWISQDFKTTLGISKSAHYLISCWVLEKDSSCLRLFTQMVKAMCYCTIKCSTERNDSRGFDFWKQSLNHWGWTIELALVLSWNFNKNLSTNGVCCVWTRCWLELVWMSSNVLFFFILTLVQ